ncbi:MAG: stage IV sporulation protein A [Lachnospiraceae bacterium]|nr:stage IV sporulation protein A [Lachnospiraceae bacterium]
MLKEYDLYQDIKDRCQGDIYIGVVGPVRTGKSTFVKRFMDELVLPGMRDENEKERAKDELPQSSGGKTITTTEPKFIPQEGARVVLGGNVDVNVRLIDCVGYMVEGAVGHMEEEVERMVRTPWFDHEIPFTQAASIGTDKVIRDHSTIGVVVTTDGSIGDIPRSNYIEAEEKTIHTLKSIKKPFVVLLNSQRPYDEETLNLKQELMDKYNVLVVPVNCKQLRREDVLEIIRQVLYEFPIAEMEFYMPKWVEMLPLTHPMKQDMIKSIKEGCQDFVSIRDVKEKPLEIQSEYITRVKLDDINLANGKVMIHADVDQSYYYQMLSELVGEEISGEMQLIAKIREMTEMKKEYAKVTAALGAVRMKGYGVVTPEKEEIRLEKPQLIKHGNKFGVKIKAESPSIHMIRAGIQTEIAPIVGSQEQAEDLIRYIDMAGARNEDIWETNIFGKSIEQLVRDGISTKIGMINDESQMKLQDTMQKIVNESSGGMICIII